MDEHKIYPLTVVADRYCGVYSGGAFTAWNYRAYELPLAIDCDDMTCCNFWRGKKARKYRVGVGDTIEDAVKALERAMRDKEGK